MSKVEADFSQFHQFAGQFSAAADQFEKDIDLFLDGLGMDLLRLVQDEIIRKKVMDTRLLLSSFSRDDTNNVWKLESGKHELVVGSTVNYAAAVNNGHWTTKEGVDHRFVPGYWIGDRFVYDRKAEGGMMLVHKWVPGTHYFDDAVEILRRMLPDLVEAKVDNWLKEHLVGFE